jgi:hypothetical protein
LKGGIWAADLFVAQTVSYRILYVFFLLRHDWREWIHFNVTASPTAAWIWRHGGGDAPRPEGGQKSR